MAYDFFFLPVALLLWVAVVGLLLFGVYWAVRLAIRHERRRELRPPQPPYGPGPGPGPGPH